MKLNEMREQSVAELEAHIETTSKELFHARLKHSLRQLENPSELRLLRHRIAQLKTVIADKKLSEAVGGSIK